MATKKVSTDGNNTKTTRTAAGTLSQPAVVPRSKPARTGVGKGK